MKSLASLRHLVPIVLALAPTAAAVGQGALVGATALSARHALLGDRLIGGSASLRFPLRYDRLTLRLGSEIVGGHTDRVGIPCGGFVLRPEDCPPEPLRDDARIINGTGGLALRLLGRRQATLALTADLIIGSVRVDTRGLASGRTLNATRMLWGGLFGVEAALVPVARLPFALEVAAGTGAMLPPPLQAEALDAYTPFDRGFGINSVRAGVAWRR